MVAKVLRLRSGLTSVIVVEKTKVFVRWEERGGHGECGEGNLFKLRAFVSSWLKFPAWVYFQTFMPGLFSGLGAVARMAWRAMETIARSRSSAGSCFTMFSTACFISGF